MKKLLTLSTTLLLLAFSGNLKAQKIKVTNGSIDAIKSEPA